MEILTQNKLSDLGVKMIRQWNKLLTKPRDYQDYNAHRPLGPRRSACYAPHNSMYIASNGDVRACCLNTKQIYGNLNHSSLQEIWNSMNRKNFCQASDNYSLPEGCKICTENFTNGNASNSTAMLYEQYGKSKWPKRIDFELSLACNLDCRMCMFSSHQNSGTKQKAEFQFGKEFLVQLKAFIPHLKLSNFYGGEPFIIPEYYDIWKLIQSTNPKTFITVQSNGSILNEKILKHLEAGRFQINFSIDSLQKERFEFIRDKAGFEQVIENFEITNRISQRKGVIQSIAVCPMKQNLEEMGELTEFANKHKSLIYFNTVNTEGFSIDELSLSELREIITILKKYQAAQSTRIERINAERFHSLLRSLENKVSQIERIQKLKDECIEIETRELIQRFTSKLDNTHNENEIKILENLPLSEAPSVCLNRYILNKIDNVSEEDILNFIGENNTEQIQEALLTFLNLEEQNSKHVQN